VPRLFINFRSRDQSGYAALLDRALSDEFGPDAVFLASRSIAPGEDFTVRILEHIRDCAVVLVVIGPDWLLHSGPGPGQDRDWVLSEIAEAFAAGRRVIPILVENAVMPRADELPEAVATLVRRQYLRLHHRTVRDDLARLVAWLTELVPELRRPTPRSPPARSGYPVHFGLGPPHASPCRLGLLPGSILDVTSVDIWVNSENTDLQMSRYNDFSISGIVRYWGARRDAVGRVIADVIADELSSRVGGPRPVAPATVVVTGPGALAESHQVRHVIHVAAVQAAVQGQPGSGFAPVERIDWCVTAVLREADRLAGADPSTRSVLLPLLGVGTGGGDLAATVVTMVDSATAFLVSHPDTALRAVYLLGYSPREWSELHRTVGGSPRLVPA
jgi:O-acetyl-ADP-ribose deacetylase (regulator of RNase III)